MNKITPFLWFDTQAEEAMEFYTTLFKNSKKGPVTRYGEGAPFPAGTAMSVTFELEGQQFFGLNAGPQFKFNEAVSFFVRCEDQAEVDELWEKILESGGEESQCGWIKDQFGLWWQIIPKQLNECLQHPDPEKAQRAMQAMLHMKKIIIADLEEAVK